MADRVRRPRTRFRSETLQPTDIQVLRVQSVQRSRPGLVRVALPRPATWVSTGFDDVVVLCLPDASGAIALPVALEGGGLSAPERGILWAREYTVRDLDAFLTVDILLHEHGPGSDWARSAKAGDRVGVVGPRLVRGSPRAEAMLAVGDLTAYPALARLVEQWPQGCRGLVLLVAPPGWDASAFGSPRAGVEVAVLQAGSDSGADVRTVVAELQRRRWADTSGFVWLAGEAGLATGLRRWLVSECGLDRDQVQFTGYWRRGSTADELD